VTKFHLAAAAAGALLVLSAGTALADAIDGD